MPGPAKALAQEADGTGMSSSSHAVVLDEPVVEAEPVPVAQTPVAINLPAVSLPVDLPTMLRQLEDAYIRAALTRTQFNKKEAAKLLGMGRTTLVEKLRRRNLAARSA
jgi:sigma-54 specific flagellar transcriptional regulator A